MDALSDAVTSASDALHPATAAVVTAWRERADGVAAGFDEKSAEGFSVQLRRELDAMAEVGGAPCAPDALVDMLRRRLDGVLAAAVNAHVRQWGVEDLKVKSGLADYAAMFPAARVLSRKLVLHLGPTNSGKTHDAMVALCKAESGTYLAPLRLMAIEGLSA